MATFRRPSSVRGRSLAFTSTSPETRFSGPPCNTAGGVSPEIFLKNPHQDFHSDQSRELEDAIFRLTLSPDSHPSSYDGSGLNNTNAKNFIFDGHGIPEWSNVGQHQSKPIVSQHPLVGYCPGSYPASDVSGISSNNDWFLADSVPFSKQMQINRTLPTAPLSNWDKFCFDLPSNSPGILNDLLSNRSSLSGLNFNVRRTHQLQQHPLTPLSVNSWRGRILSLAKDQYGCRFLQETMKSLIAEDISLIFFELIDYVDELMLNQFGNYVVQKLVEVCTEEQRTQIILVVTKDDFLLVSICLNMHGTRAVQKLLEHVTTQEQRSLIMAALSPGAVALTKDVNGHHVILHCLKHFSDEDNKYLLNEVANNCFGIATDKSGCCVLQQCVNHAKGETKEHLMAEIIENAPLLAEDCYGNYVVQHLISLKIPEVTARLLRQLGGKFFSLSRNKYGSNVVEKFFQDSGEQYSNRIILELLDDPNVSILLVDAYGNYVIKSAMMVSKGPLRNALRDLIEAYSPMMRSNLYGKKLLARFDKEKLRHM